MAQSIIIQDQDLMDVISNAVAENSQALMSHLSQGKWDSRNVRISGVSDFSIHVKVDPDDSDAELDMAIDQPVGVSLLQGFSKYIFEATVLGFEPSVNQRSGGTIVLNKPYSMERMQRRAYSRIDVPDNMKVDVLFWHRGYTDGKAEVPLEHYWQGRLMDLSAGGLQIEVDRISIDNFRTGQVVGLQFTPMPYDKPIVLEALVRRIVESPNPRCIVVGVEFLGLESEGAGRQKLHRIIDTINKYESANLSK